MLFSKGNVDPKSAPFSCHSSIMGAAFWKPAHVSCAHPARCGLSLSSFFFLHRATLTLLAILLHFIPFTKAGVCVKPLTWQEAVHLIDLLVESSPLSALLPRSKLRQLNAATNHMLWDVRANVGVLSSVLLCRWWLWFIFFPFTRALCSFQCLASYANFCVCDMMYTIYCDALVGWGARTCGWPFHALNM